MKTVLVPLANGCEELEAVTIIDLLRRADITVVTVGLDNQSVRCSRGTVITPDTTIDSVMGDSFDMVVLPGGLPGADHLRDDSRVQKVLKQHASENKYTAAICAAPKALAEAGLLTHRKATSYPGVLDALNLKNTTISNQAVEIDGKVITSRGPGTAMDFALTLIEILEGPEKRKAVEDPLCR